MKNSRRSYVILDEACKVLVRSGRGSGCVQGRCSSGMNGRGRRQFVVMMMVVLACACAVSVDANVLVEIIGTRETLVAALVRTFKGYKVKCISKR